MKILIIKLSSIGDIVHAIPALNLLAESLPEAKIDWLVYEKFLSLIKNQEAINEVKVLPDKKLSTLYDTIRYLQQENYDLVIDLQGLIKTALIAKFAGKQALGFANPREKIASFFYDIKYEAENTITSKKHIIDQNLDLINFFRQEYLGLEASHQVSFGKLGYNFFTETKDKEKYSKLCIIPSTTWESKFWKAEYWAELLSILKKKYNSEIYLLGTENDLSCLEEIISKLKTPFHLVLDRGLDELSDFFRDMNLIIGVDTGPLHIAAASAYPYSSSGKKIIGIYGPTSAARTGPYGFESLSFDEIYQTKASHKRKIKDDGGSMALIKPEHILAILN